MAIKSTGSVTLLVSKYNSEFKTAPVTAFVTAVRTMLLWHGANRSASSWIDYRVRAGSMHSAVLACFLDFSRSACSPYCCCFLAFTKCAYDPTPFAQSHERQHRSALDANKGLWRTLPFSLFHSAPTASAATPKSPHRSRPCRTH